MSNTQISLIGIPENDLRQIKEDLRYLRQSAITKSSTDYISDNREWLPRLEFMKICNIGSTHFNIMKNNQKLVLNKVGRKLFVHRSCVDQYFQGQIL